jgi:hypothetical protein
MMFGGWQKKALTLREVLLSAGHQVARELPSSISTMLELYREAAKTGDLTQLEAFIAEPRDEKESKPMWEPASIYGWEIQATFYRLDGKLWWLVRAERRGGREPTEKDIGMLDKVLDLLGAQPMRDMVIGPRSNCASDGFLAFGYWTWPNRHQLNEIQVKGKKGQDITMRIVPHGTRPTDGYESVDLSAKADLDDP